MRTIPLTKANRVKIARAFYGHIRYDVTLDSVIEGQMGKAYVNQVDDVDIMRVEIEPFNYFAGDVSHADAALMVSALKPNCFVMPGHSGFEDLISEVFGNRVHQMKRSLYGAQQLDGCRLNNLLESVVTKGQIHRLDSKRAKKVFEDEKTMIYLKNFDSASDFSERGVGFVMEIEGKIVGAAYSTIISGSKAQIALNVSHAYRKQGIATLLAIHFVKYCLENTIEPVWVANNQETCQLAERLGFVLDTTYTILFIAEE